MSHISAYFADKQNDAACVSQTTKQPKENAQDQEQTAQNPCLKSIEGDLGTVNVFSDLKYSLQPRFRLRTTSLTKITGSYKKACKKIAVDHLNYYVHRIISKI